MNKAKRPAPQFIDPFPVDLMGGKNGDSKKKGTKTVQSAIERQKEPMPQGDQKKRS